jgi:hypothetical protein
MLQVDMMPHVPACCSQKFCRLFEHVAAEYVAACSSMLQLQAILLLVLACCRRTFGCLFEHVAAGHFTTCLSMLQPEILPPV